MKLYFKKKNITTTNKPGVLDVYSLANIKQNYDEIDTSVLINTRNEKREKKLDIFMKYFNNCFEKIKILNASNKTDIIYEVPKIIPDCFEYRPADCVQFIETKLRMNGFDTYKIDSTRLFITWKYIEANNEQIKKH